MDQEDELLIIQQHPSPHKPSTSTPLPSSHRPSSSSARRVSSLHRSSSATASPRPLPPLPLPLISYLCDQLLSSPGSDRVQQSIVPTPNLFMALSLVRSSLSSSSLSISPREEIEMRLLEGNIGLEAVKLLMGIGVRKHDAHQGDLWRERGKNEARQVERGLGKAISLCQRHASISDQFLWRLLLLQANTISLLGNHKYAIKTLKKALDNQSFPLIAQYHLLFSLSTHYINCTPPSPSLALSTLTTLHSLASSNGESTLELVVSIAKLGVLAREGSWREARRFIEIVRSNPTLQPLLPPPTDSISFTSKGKEPMVVDDENDQAEKVPTVLEKQLLIHFLCFTTLVLNHMGEGTEANGMVKLLHNTLDEGNEGTEGLGGGVWEIPLKVTSHGTKGDDQSKPVPLLIHFTPPHVLYVLACLITSLSKRDPAVKRPKKRVFAEEGIRQLDQGPEATPGVSYPPFATVLHAQEWAVDQAVIRAELQCEIIGVAIVRSEFKEAEDGLALLIAHLRGTSLFSTFSAQVTLLQAHLSHATGQTERALSLYRASHYLALQTCSISASSRDLAVAAKLGEMGLMIGLGRMAEVRSECEKVAKGCWGNGTGWMNDERNASGNGTPKMEASGAENVVLKIAGGLLLALMEKEILRSKQHLKSCLDLSSASSDNTARPIILSLTAALFLNTREKQSLVMLQTALHLSRLLGKEGSNGHAALGLWLGEKYENVLRKNKDPKADGVAKLNGIHRAKLDQLSSFQSSFKAKSGP